MLKTDKQFIIACTLGDGCINKRLIKGKYLSYRFLMKHSIKQVDYFKYKAKRLEKILSKKPREKYYYINHNSGRSNITALQYEKSCIDRLKPLYHLIYRNNKKIFSRKVLNKLNPEGLAIWYMDDGSLYNAKHTRKDGSQYYSKCRITLNTYLSYEENKIVQKYFDEVWDIQWNINKDKDFYRLSAGTKQARKFFSIIKNYIHESMLYKVDIKVTQEVIK